MSILRVGSTPAPFTPPSDAQATAANLGPGSVYYKLSSTTVSSTSNDGTLTSGQSVTISPSTPAAFVSVNPDTIPGNQARLSITLVQPVESAGPYATVDTTGNVPAKQLGNAASGVSGLTDANMAAANVNGAAATPSLRTTDGASGSAVGNPAGGQAGDTLLHDGTKYQRLGKGTVGQRLAGTGSTAAWIGLDRRKQAVRVVSKDTGSDSNTGASEDEPFQTVTAAVQAIQAMQTSFGTSPNPYGGVIRLLPYVQGGTLDGYRITDPTTFQNIANISVIGTTPSGGYKTTLVQDFAGDFIPFLPGAQGGCFENIQFQNQLYQNTGYGIRATSTAAASAGFTYFRNCTWGGGFTRNIHIDGEPNAPGGGARNWFFSNCLFFGAYEALKSIYLRRLVHGFFTACDHVQAPGGSGQTTLTVRISNDLSSLTGGTSNWPVGTVVSGTNIAGGTTITGVSGTLGNYTYVLSAPATGGAGTQISALFDVNAAMRATTQGVWIEDGFSEEIVYNGYFLGNWYSEAGTNAESADTTGPGGTTGGGVVFNGRLDGSITCAGPANTFTITGDTHSNTTIDNVVLGSSAIVLGQAITGAGIPASTTISAWSPSTSTITISHAATATTAGVTLTVAPLNSNNNVFYGVINGSFTNNGGTSNAIIDQFAINDLRSAYRVVHEARAQVDAGVLAGAGTIVLGGAFEPVASDPHTALAYVYIDPADYAVNRKTTKFRTRVTLLTNATAPGCNFTTGLVPTSGNPAGGASTVTQANGTFVSGGAPLITAPAATSQNHAEGSDFTLTAGWYALATSTSGAMTASSAVAVIAQLQVHNV